MDIKTLIGIVVQASLFSLVLAVGLRSNWSDLLYAFRKPAAFGRAMVAVNVVVPLTACLLSALLPLNWMTKAGLIVMAVSPLAPFVPGKMMKSSEDEAYDVGVYAALVLAAIVIVPLTITLLNQFYTRQGEISVAALTWFVAKSVLIPLAAGIAIATLWPSFAKRAASVVTMATYIVLLPLTVLFLIKAGPQMQGLIGDGTLVVIVGTIAAGLAAGHWLGGSDPRHPGHRVALAQAAATRNPGIAGLIAAHGDPGITSHVMNAVLLFLIVSVVMSALYAQWAGRRLAAGESATEGSSS